VRSQYEDGHALLSVQDAGPSLRTPSRSASSTGLYRADAARGRDSGGLGLGLPIAKAIVDAHHGTLAVRSAPGHGCTFTVLLPVAPQAA
jgi:signal transduction histidine kinase